MFLVYAELTRLCDKRFMSFSLQTTFRATGSASPTLALSAWLGLALTLPMIVSGLVFETYDISTATVASEIARQFNLPFLLAELGFVVWAWVRGMRLRALLMRLDRPALLALALFLASFWVGGVTASPIAPFAALFNLTYILHVCFAGALVSLAHSAKRRNLDAAVFLQVVTAALAAFVVMTAIRFSTPPPGRAIDTINWQFAIPGFISVRLFGACVAPWAALAAWLALTRGDCPEYRHWTFLALALSFGIVFWTATRAAIVGLGVVGLVALWRFRLRPSVGLLARAAIALVSGAAIATLLLPYGDPTFMFFVPADGASVDAATGGRFSLWREVWLAYQAVPWFGAGPGATSWILPTDQFPHIQPHNLILQFLITWGLPATLAALYLITRAVHAAHRIADQCREAIPYVLIADCLLVMSFFDGIFHFAQPVMIWMAAMAVVFAVGGRAASEETTTSP